MRAPTDAPSRTGVQWALALAAPLAWAVQLTADWYLSEVVACAPATDPQAMVAGMSIQTAAVLVNAVTLAVAVAAGALSWRDLRRLRDAGDPTAGNRATWMATAGVMGGVLFAIAILVGTAPALMLSGCERFGP